MKKYVCKQTKKTKELLVRIERVKIMVKEFPVSMRFEEDLRRRSLLKSSLFSAQIEGNPLQLDQITIIEKNQADKNRNKLEVSNVLTGLKWIRSKRSPRRLSMKVIKELHERVMKGLSGNAGTLRKKSSAIFNSAGIAVRLNPSPQMIKELLKEWLVWIKKLREVEPVPVIVALAHLSFEKIHPFVDGNGRVGRLVSQFVLDRGGFGFKGLVSFEEYLLNHRQIYYDLLAFDKSDATEFVEFFLEGIVESGEKTARKLKRSLTKKVKQKGVEESLLPRRKEVLQIIREHKMVSFDSLCRRFGKVNPHTLRYDLQQLMKTQLVRKLGGTRGALYEKK